MEEQLTLSELNSLISETLKLSFPEKIWVKAEISELKVNRNGHCYLELVDKDENENEISARARATIWSWQFRFIQAYFESNSGQILGAGIKVLIQVSVEFHEVYGYSLNITDIDPTYTLGDIARRRREIIKKLEQEGVIDMNKEIEMADIPSRIAVVSSPTAAGYEDFVNQLLNNNKGFKFYIRLFPSQMQGNDAPASIMNSLDLIYDYEDHFDVVAIIRGGGSQLDLSCFDNPDLAMHIAQFPLPVITGIGHEKDESIADMVAHTKLKTPTAVAEFIIGKMEEAADDIEELESLFLNRLTGIIKNEESRLSYFSKTLISSVKSQFDIRKQEMKHLPALVKPSIDKLLERNNYRLRNYKQFLAAGSSGFLNKKMNSLSNVLTVLQLRNKIIISREESRIKLFDKSLELVDPVNVLKRGYSITLNNGKAIKSSKDIHKGDTLKTILFDGEVISNVNDIKR
ncbi:MAG: exodeoxyribonuclease VII large subunit [Prolixibacteraceae bacterium]|nr:exodeoxyribonuclease VII large subunit [Prolixibacteraceae bacterium]